MDFATNDAFARVNARVHAVHRSKWSVSAQTKNRNMILQFNIQQFYILYYTNNTYKSKHVSSFLHLEVAAMSCSAPSVSSGGGQRTTRCSLARQDMEIMAIICQLSFKWQIWDEQFYIWRKQMPIIAAFSIFADHDFGNSNPWSSQIFVRCSLFPGWSWQDLHCIGSCTTHCWGQGTTELTGVETFLRWRNFVELFNTGKRCVFQKSQWNFCSKTFWKFFD